MFVAQMVVIKEHYFEELCSLGLCPAFVRKKLEKNASGINSIVY